MKKNWSIQPYPQARTHASAVAVSRPSVESASPPARLPAGGLPLSIRPDLSRRPTSLHPPGSAVAHPPRSRRRRPSCLQPPAARAPGWLVALPPPARLRCPVRSQPSVRIQHRRPSRPLPASHLHAAGRHHADAGIDVAACLLQASV
jgi:hypothetical protein